MSVVTPSPCWKHNPCTTKEESPPSYLLSSGVLLRVAATGACGSNSNSPPCTDSDPARMGGTGFADTEEIPRGKKFYVGCFSCSQTENKLRTLFKTTAARVFCSLPPLVMMPIKHRLVAPAEWPQLRAWQPSPSQNTEASSKAESPPERRAADGKLFAGTT